jgi:hypothetical protein
MRGETMAERSTYASTALDFPSVICPIIVTCVGTLFYLAPAVLLMRATVGELRRVPCCKKGPTGLPRCTHALENYTLVVCLACAASLASIASCVVHFVPTVVHATMKSDGLTVVVAIASHLLRATTDCLWFAAWAQLVAYWLELHATKRAVKRAKRFCWFSGIVVMLFAVLRMGAAVAAPLSSIAQLTVLALAFLVAWAVPAAWIIGVVRLRLQTRATVAHNRTTEAVRDKLQRIARFHILPVVFFAVFNVAAAAGAVGLVWTERARPIVVLVWELPVRLCQWAFYTSVAVACSLSNRPPPSTSRRASVSEQKVRARIQLRAIASMRTLGEARRRGQLRMVVEARRHDAAGSSEDEALECMAFDLALESSFDDGDDIYDDGFEDVDERSAERSYDTHETDYANAREPAAGRSASDHARGADGRELCYYYDDLGYGEIVQGPFSAAELSLLVAEGLVNLDYLVREGQTGEPRLLRSVVQRGVASRRVAGEGWDSSDGEDDGWDDGPVFEIKQGLDRGNVSFYGNTLFEVPGELEGRDSRNSPSLEKGGSIDGALNGAPQPATWPQAGPQREAETLRDRARDSMPFHPAPRFTASGREAFFGLRTAATSLDRYAMLAAGPVRVQSSSSECFSDTQPGGDEEGTTRTPRLSDTSRVLNAVRLSLMALAAGNPPPQRAGRTRGPRP